MFKYNLSAKLSTDLLGSEVLLFSEFINIVYMLYYIYIELIKLLYTFLAISFDRYKEYITLWVSISKCFGVLLAFT